MIELNFIVIGIEIMVTEVTVEIPSVTQSVTPQPFCSQRIASKSDSMTAKPEKSMMRAYARRCANIYISPNCRFGGTTTDVLFGTQQIGCKRVYRDFPSKSIAHFLSSGFKYSEKSFNIRKSAIKFLLNLFDSYLMKRIKSNFDRTMNDITIDKTGWKKWRFDEFAQKLILQKGHQ